jgi:hypothetical protein
MVAGALRIEAETEGKDERHMLNSFAKAVVAVPLFREISTTRLLLIIVLWYVPTLLGNDLEISNYKIVSAK